MESRMTGLESRMITGFESLDSRLTSVESRTTSVEIILTAFRTDALSHFDGVYKRFDRHRLESEYHALSVAVKRIEDHHEREN